MSRFSFVGPTEPTIPLGVYRREPIIEALRYYRDHLSDYELDNPSGDWKSLTDAISVLQHMKKLRTEKPRILQH